MTEREALLASKFRLDGEDVIRLSTGRVVVDSGERDYFSVNVKQGMVIEYHRLKFFLANGYLPQRVDHKDRNPRNNRKANLRAATHIQNLWNSSKPRRDLPRGVYRKGTRYRAAASFNGKQIYLGSHASAEAASQAVEDCLAKLHGEFYAPRGQ